MQSVIKLPIWGTFSKLSEAKELVIYDGLILVLF